MIQAAIFDMDGLMFDTEPVWTELWAPSLAKQGLEEKPGLADDSRGRTGESLRRVLRRYYGDDVDADAVISTMTRLATDRFAQPVPKKPGLDELLDFLDANDVPMAVASSSPEPLIRNNLRNAGLSERFEAVVSGVDLPRAKPFPDIFLDAAARLGADPAHSMVLEDSLAGVRAGAAGGFITVMVPDMVAPDETVTSLYDVCCDSLYDVRDLLEEGKLGTSVA